MPDSDPSEIDRLSGWKEIAEHLRRSVRSAQRWERELGLPVQRVQTLKGQVVYASRAELDAWLASHQASLGEADARRDPPDGPVESDLSLAADSSVPPLPATRRAWWSLGALVAAGLTLAIFFWVSGRPGLAGGATAPQMQYLHAIGRSVEARAPTGDLVWSLDMDAEVRRVMRTQLSISHSTESAGTVDLLGHGNLVHLMPVAFGASEVTIGRSDALLAIDGTGELLWQVSPDLQLSCGGQQVSGPWRIRSVAVSSDPGPRRLWVSYVHHTDWQSFVLEVAADGAASLRYVQPGWVMSLAEWQTERGRVLVAGGVLNERRRASVALIDLDAADRRVSLMPARDAAFACDVGETIPPVQVHTFPPYDLNAAYGVPYTMVDQMSVVGADLRVHVNYSNQIAMLGPDGRVVSLTETDVYRSHHDAAANAGRLDHFAHECPDLTASVRRIWTWIPGQDWQASEVGRAGER